MSDQSHTAAQASHGGGEGDQSATHGSERRKPNILVTGTPGTGKSTLCDLLEVCLISPVCWFASSYNYWMVLCMAQENIGFVKLNVGHLVRQGPYVATFKSNSSSHPLLFGGLFHRYKRTNIIVAATKCLRRSSWTRIQKTRYTQTWFRRFTGACLTICLVTAAG